MLIVSTSWKWLNDAVDSAFDLFCEIHAYIASMYACQIHVYKDWYVGKNTSALYE